MSTEQEAPTAYVMEWPLARPGGQFYVQHPDPKIRLRWHRTWQAAQAVADRENRKAQR